MKIFYVSLLVLLSLVFSSECYAQNWCFHKRVNNVVYPPYYIPYGYYNSDYYTQPVVPVVVQTSRLVPVMENRVEYRSVVGGYYMNYGHYYSYPTYVNYNNSYYNPYHVWSYYNY